MAFALSWEGGCGAATTSATNAVRRRNLVMKIESLQDLFVDQLRDL
jgi:hypothetical protein